MVDSLEPEAVMGYANLLKKNTFLKNLTENDIAYFITHGEYYVLGPDYYLIREGEKGNDFFILLAGEVAVITPSDEGCDIELNRLGQFDTFGEIGCILNTKRTASIKTVKKTHILRYDNDKFNLMLSTINGLSLALVHELARRLHHAFKDNKV